MTTFLYVLYAFAGLGVICLILACTPWVDGTPAEPPAWNDDDPAWAAAMGIDLERSGQP
jgi:hypothetical protein